MNTLGWINNNEYEEAVNYIPEVFDQTLTQNKAPYVIDYVQKLLKDDLKDIKSGGYKIDLTIDLDAQDIAKESLKFAYKKIIDRDKRLQKNSLNNVIKKDGEEIPVEEGYFVDTLNGAMVSIENNTGKILALVGGIDYKESSFNRAVQSKRQPGSAVKPFIYHSAIELGYSPASQVVDIGRTYEYTIGEEEKNGNLRIMVESLKG